MTESDDEYRYDVYCKMLRAEKAFYLAWAAGLGWASLLLFVVSGMLVFALFKTKTDFTCQRVAAEYQYIIQHTPDAVAPQDGE